MIPWLRVSLAPLVAAVVLLLSCAARTAMAHPMSFTEMQARLTARELAGELRVDAVDGPTEARWARVERELRTGLFVKVDQSPVRCEFRVSSWGDPSGVDRAATDQVAFQCPLPAGPRAVTLKATQSFGSLRAEILDDERNAVVRLDLAPGDETAPLDDLLAAAPPAPLHEDTVPSSPLDAPHQVLARYLLLGFEHILPLGLDHILFVLALFFLSPRLKPLLVQLTTFTAAHSLTLALVAAGVMSPPASLVEPLIAASIVFVGVENLTRRTVGPARVGVVGMFGLLHGMGFAGALHELGLPEGREALALLGFNIGVELGQVTIVLLALGLTWRAQVEGEHPSWIRVPASGAIALMGLVWVVERVFV